MQEATIERFACSDERLVTHEFTLVGLHLRGLNLVAHSHEWLGRDPTFEGLLLPVPLSLLGGEGIVSVYLKVGPSLVAAVCLVSACRVLLCLVHSQII